MKIRPVGAELHHAGRRTDRHDVANSRFTPLLRPRLMYGLEDVKFPNELNIVTFFDTFLTLHLSIILVINQLNAQILLL